MDQLLDIITKTNKPATQILQEFVEAEKLMWPLAASNYKGLEKVEEKSFQFDGFQVKAQFNPERMRSSVAEVDKQSIAARKCFLCSENRPPEQDGIPFGDDFLILVNPFPIFKNHFTISCNRHIDQRFIPNVKTLLELAKAMERFTVFYNGPECGASAPDHLHFQAGESNFMPISEDFNRLKHTAQMLYSNDQTEVVAFDNYLRKMISIETNSMEEALKVIDVYYRHFAAMQPEKVEPMMNVLCSFSEDKVDNSSFSTESAQANSFLRRGRKTDFDQSRIC